MLSCQEFQTDNSKGVCGTEMSEMDYSYFTQKSTEQSNNPYVEDGHKFYEIVNDSIRLKFPDTLTFEIFLSFSSKDEIAILVFGPDNEAFMNQLRCAFFNSQFATEIPSKKYLVLQLYTNPDGSGDNKFGYALKN
jgi:hypothetical protein